MEEVSSTSSEREKHSKKKKKKKKKRTKKKEKGKIQTSVEMSTFNSCQAWHKLVTKAYILLMFLGMHQYPSLFLISDTGKAKLYNFTIIAS